MLGFDAIGDIPLADVGDSIVASAAIGLSDASLVATGEHVESRIAASTVTLDAASLAATGVLSLSAAAAITLSDATLGATADLSDPVASGAVVLDAVGLAAAGVVKIAGASDTTLADARVVSASTLNISALGVIVLEPASLAGHSIQGALFYEDGGVMCVPWEDRTLVVRAESSIMSVPRADDIMERLREYRTMKSEPLRRAC